MLNMSSKKKKISWEKKRRGEFSCSCQPLLGVMKKSEEMYTWPLSEDGRKLLTLTSGKRKMVISRVFLHSSQRSVTCLLPTE